MVKDLTELHCSPKAHVENAEDGNYTCFSKPELKLLAAEFNKKSPKKIKITGKKKEIVNQLLEAYKEVCDKHQFCWIKQTLTDPEKIAKLEKSFRPKMPDSWNDNPNTWLNTYDILYVMKQYEDLHKDFVFIGIYPIDFNESNSFGRCIGDILCNFDIKTNILDKGKKQFGIVFNTDPSTRSGSHWYSMYCNLNPNKKNYGIYSYDSVANEAQKQVKLFMKKVCDQVNDKKFECKENKIQRQFSNYDCGVYSMVFITQCLKNIPFKIICEKMQTDKYVNSFRQVLYRPSRIKKNMV